MSRRVLPVSSLVHYLKETMEENPILHGILVEGEVSNLRVPASGHWYFSLKDERASISCVMFASANRRVSFRPKNGDKVTVGGDVSVYEAGGSMQIIAQSMNPSGIGELFLQLEALKKKLSAEGIFNEDHKKELPLYPMDIALVTGNQTAGREDVLITLHKRWPAASIHEYPCPVQGKEAAVKITEALRKADEGNHDVILLVRGGGSFEDLWCFNDENLARAIYAAKTPIITGIGHETDFTIADYAADVRANTPTGAVETAVPDINEVMNTLLQYKIRMQTAVKNDLTQDRTVLNRMMHSTVFTHPERLYSEQANTLNFLNERLMKIIHGPQMKRSEMNQVLHRFYAVMNRKDQHFKDTLQGLRTQMILDMNERINVEKSQLKDLNALMGRNTQELIKNQKNRMAVNIKLLDAYSPLKIMDRGYSIVMKSENVVSSVKDMKVNDDIDVRMKDGILHAKISGKEIKNG